MAGLETTVRTPRQNTNTVGGDFFSTTATTRSVTILKAIKTCTYASDTTKDFVLGAFQQYLRNNNLFCIWNITRQA